MALQHRSTPLPSHIHTRNHTHPVHGHAQHMSMHTWKDTDIRDIPALTGRHNQTERVPICVCECDTCFLSHVCTLPRHTTNRECKGYGCFLAVLHCHLLTVWEFSAHSHKHTLARKAHTVLQDSVPGCYRQPVCLGKSLLRCWMWRQFPLAVCLASKRLRLVHRYNIEMNRFREQGGS